MPMAIVSWKNPITGNWTVGNDWSNGTGPGPNDDAVIATAGNYTVSITTSIDVNSITISDAGATLFVNDPNNTVTVAAGLTNSGALDVDTSSGEGGSSLGIGGTLTNLGTTTIGVSNLSASTTVSAQSLANTGTL